MAVAYTVNAGRRNSPGQPPNQSSNGPKGACSRPLWTEGGRLNRAGTRGTQPRNAGMKTSLFSYKSTAKGLSRGPTQPHRRSRSHSSAAGGSTVRAIGHPPNKYKLFYAAMDGCLECVTRLVLREGVPTDVVSDTHKYAVSDYVEWGATHGRKGSHDDVKSFLREQAGLAFGSSVQ